MYLTCEKCGETNHISLWSRLGRFGFKCPKCGHTQYISNNGGK
jgi:predicted nucleic-acid-binding Zn-ribbon protein